MKLVILAGGLGTRISEESHLRPKPLIEIGGKPILWHIMKLLAAHDVREFVICCGYKGYLIKEYFANYFLHMSDVTFDMSANQMQVHLVLLSLCAGRARRPRAQRAPRAKSEMSCGVAVSKPTTSSIPGSAGSAIEKPFDSRPTTTSRASMPDAWR